MKDDFAEGTKPPSVPPAQPAVQPAAVQPAHLSVKAKDKLFAALPGKPLLRKIRETLQPAGRFLAGAGGEIRRFFKKDSAPNLVLVMTLLAVVTAAGVGAARAAAEGRIREARAEAAARGMEKVFSGLELRFTQSYMGENVYEGRNEDGVIQGFAILVSVGGENGPVDMVVGVNILREVTDVYIFAHRELRDLSDAMARGAREALAALDWGEGP